MADNNTIQTSITTDASGVKSGMDAAANAVKSGSDAIKSAMGGLGDAFSMVTGKIALLGAVIGGAGVFNAGIAAVKEQAGQVMSLSRTIGITTGDATILNTALQSVGLSAEDYNAAAASMTKATIKNADAFEKLGIQTKDSNGQMLPMSQQISNTLEKINEFKAGADRQKLSMELLGRSYESLIAVAKLTPEVEAKAAKAVQELHLALDPAVVKKYGEAQRDFGQVMQGIQLAIGRGAMPALTEMARWFREIGPTAVEVTITTMQVLGIVFEQVKGIVLAVWGQISGIFSGFGEIFGTTGLSAMSMKDIIVDAFKIIGSIIVVSIATAQVQFAIFKAAIELVSVSIGVFAELVSSQMAAVGGLLKASAKVWSSWSEVVGAALHGDFDAAKEAFNRGLKETSDGLGGFTAKIKANNKEALTSMGAVSKEVAIGLGKNLIAIATDTKTQLDKIAKGPSDAASQKPKGGDRTDDPLNKDKTKKAEDLAQALIAIEKAKQAALLAAMLENDKAIQDYEDNAFKRGLIGIKQYYGDRLAIIKAEGSVEVEAKEKILKAITDAKAGETDQVKRLKLEAEEIKAQSDLTLARSKAAQAEVKNQQEMKNALEDRARAIQDIEINTVTETALAKLEADKANDKQRLDLRQITTLEFLAEEREYARQSADIELERLRLRAQGLSTDSKEYAQYLADREKVERDTQKKISDVDRQEVMERSKYQLEAMNSVEQAMGTLFTDIGTGAKKATDAFKDFAKSVINDLIRMQAQAAAKQITSSLFGKLFGGGETGGGSSGIEASQLAGNIFGVTSFDTGTPYVPKDMLAYIHKGEAVIPAAQNNGGGGGGGGVVVTQNIQVDARGADQGVDAKIMQAMNAAKNAAVDAVQQSLLRGGSMARAIGR